MEKFPKANTVNTVQQTINGELLLYNTTTNKAVCLNQTSADIYTLCDGTNGIDSIAVKANLPKEIVKLAVSDLSRQDLLMQKIELQTSRRDLLKGVALTAVVLPTISILVAPTAAHAQSNCGAAAPGGFFIGRFPSGTGPGQGTNVCAEPAACSCQSGTFGSQSTCNNAECSTVDCYCAPVGVINAGADG